MNYTEQEKQVINEAFLVTRKEFDKDQNINDDKIVLKSLNLFQDKYHMPRSYNHDCITIFNKLGYSNNGKQTLQEFAREQKSKKVQMEMQLNKVRKKRLDRIEQLEKLLQEKKKQITIIPERIQEGMQLDSDLLIKQVKVQIEEMHRVKINEMDRIIRETNTEMEAKIISERQKILSQLEKAKNIRLNRLYLDIQEGAKEFDEIIAEILIESEKTPMELKIEKNIEEFNQVIKPQEQNLLNYTVRELKELADSRGIEYPARIVKAELVELLEG